MDRADRQFVSFAGWIAAHLLAYAAVAISIRYLATYFQIIEIAAIRSLGSLLIAGTLLLNSRRKMEFTGLHLVEDIRRSFLHLVGSLALIWSVVNLPLSFISTIEFSGPLFATIIGWIAFRKRPDRRTQVGLAMIALGCMAMFHQQGLSQNATLVIPVIAVFILTVTNIMLANLARTRRVSSIIFVMHCIQFPAYLLLVTVLSPEWLDLMIAKARQWDGFSWACILAAAAVLSFAGFVTQAALANASRHGTPLQLCAADVLRLPLITLIGFAVFSEAIGGAQVVLGLVIIAGAIIASLPGSETGTQ